MTPAQTTECPHEATLTLTANEIDALIVAVTIVRNAETYNPIRRQAVFPNFTPAATLWLDHSLNKLTDAASEIRHRPQD